MGTKADFYVGRGNSAEWVGSISWDGYPDGLPPEVRTAKTEEDYREQVKKWIANRPDAHHPEKGWPWTWDDSRTTNYAYAFDEGRVWACCFGSSWWRAEKPEPEHIRLKRKVSVFPDMSLVDKKSGGPDGLGVFIAPAKKSRKRR